LAEEIGPQADSTPTAALTASLHPEQAEHDLYWSSMKEDLDQTIRRILEEEDIEGLIEMGAPRDEYDTEASRIEGRIRRLPNPDEGAVTGVVEAVWNEMFGPFDSSEMRQREDSIRRLTRRIAEAVQGRRASS
jgi:hypothetical protein